MPRNPLKLKIAYLYPDILQGFCDIANVSAFVQRATLRDIEVQLFEIQRNDKVQASKFDFYYIGGSNISGLKLAQTSLNQNSEELKIAAISKVPILAVDCGYILFGNSYQPYNDVQATGLGILNIDSYSKKDNTPTLIRGYCKFLKDASVVGYKSSLFEIEPADGSIPFISLKSTFYDRTVQTEGTRLSNVIGTSITSPILAQNPHLCDFFIMAALKAKYRCIIPLAPLCDDIEWFSHKYIFESR